MVLKDEHQQDSVRGQVVSPDTDKRLVDNGGGGPHNDGRGRVNNPGTDKRLHENIENSQDKQSEIQHITRLQVQGMTYEGIQLNSGSTIRVSIEDKRDGEMELTSQDIKNVIQFFTTFQRESRRNQHNLS